MGILNRILGREDNADTHYWAGVNYEKRHMYKEAEKEYWSAINLDSCHYKAYCNLGSIISRNRGRMAEAVRCFERALEICPNDSLSNYNLGCVYYLNYSEVEALEYLSNAIIADHSVEPRVHAMIRSLSYPPYEDILKLGKLVDAKAHREQAGVLKVDTNIVPDKVRVESSRYEVPVNQVYKNDKYGFSIKYPSGWQVKPDMTSSHLVIDLVGPGALNISISVCNTAVTSKPLEVTEREAAESNAKMNCSLVYAKRRKMDSVDAVEHVVDTSWGSRIKVVGFFRNGVEFTMLCGTGGHGDYHVYESVFNECLQSFKFT